MLGLCGKQVPRLMVQSFVLFLDSYSIAIMLFPFVRVTINDILIYLIYQFNWLIIDPGE